MSEDEIPSPEILRRALLGAWHDLKWYRANVKEHPGHAQLTLDRIVEVLHALGCGLDPATEGSAPSQP